MFKNMGAATRTLILINVGAYALNAFVGDVGLLYFALWPWHTSGLGEAPSFEVWQLVTYGFLHDPDNPAHIFFNMFALYMFGSDVERVFGVRRFLVYYFVCVIGAALAQLATMAMANTAPVATVGASGGIFGVLLAFGMFFPQRRILLLFPPIPMPAWLFVTLYGVLELTMGVLGTQQGVAHFAHLGGMAAGYLLIRHWRRARD